MANHQGEKGAGRTFDTEQLLNNFVPNTRQNALSNPTKKHEETTG